MLTPRTADFVRGLSLANSGLVKTFCAAPGFSNGSVTLCSLTTAWAARRAAATNLARTGADVSAAFAMPFTASDAAIRSILRLASPEPTRRQSDPAVADAIDSDRGVGSRETHGEGCRNVSAGARKLLRRRAGRPSRRKRAQGDGSVGKTGCCAECLHQPLFASWRPANKIRGSWRQHGLARMRRARPRAVFFHTPAGEEQVPSATANRRYRPALRRRRKRPPGRCPRLDRRRGGPFARDGGACRDCDFGGHPNTCRLTPPYPPQERGVPPALSQRRCGRDAALPGEGRVVSSPIPNALLRGRRIVTRRRDTPPRPCQT